MYTEENDLVLLNVGQTFFKIVDAQNIIIVLDDDDSAVVVVVVMATLHVYSKSYVAKSIKVQHTVIFHNCSRFIWP